VQSLFETPTTEVPLAHRLRPTCLDEVEGQPELTDAAAWFAAAIREKRAVSCLFWGPPGVGKTTLASLMAKAVKMPFVTLSAVSAGKKEVQEVVAQAKAKHCTYLLFLDEIHRFNKAQQDVLLPYMEDGTLILIGATTENPSFHLNNALLSRCRVVVLKALPVAAIERIMQRGLRVLQQDATHFDVEEDAIAWLSKAADGDARYALNALQALFEAGAEQCWQLDVVQQQWLRRQANYDRDGDGHYDLISALHKSIRSSDVDAACYWLARMLEAGDEPLYIARRLIRIATEDIGLADPQALHMCLDAQQMYQALGSPEGEQGLFEAAVYLALSPKSNAVYLAEKAARKLARETQHLDVPIHLKNAPTTLMKQLGHGEGYQYAHHAKNAVVSQSHFPDALGDIALFEPVERGFERTLGERMQWFKKQRDALRKGEGS